MLLEIEKLNTFYGRLHALWDVDIQVEKGSIVALIGSNGAGKSTLLKSIAGTVKPRSGRLCTTARIYAVCLPIGLSLGASPSPRRGGRFSPG